LVDSMAPTHICPEGPFTTQVHPSSFNLEKLGWGDSWTASMSCHSELSITGDTAKYLVLTLPTTRTKVKSYCSSNSTRRCKAKQARQKLRRQEFIKTPTHASSTRKATRPKLSVGQGKHGDTCLGEEKSWCTRHTDTRCTQHNLHMEYSIIST
jgi:hypothetical protein